VTKAREYVSVTSTNNTPTQLRDQLTKAIDNINKL